MTSTDQDYLDCAAAIQKQIRERPSGTTALAAMARALRGFEGLIAMKYTMAARHMDAVIVDTFAEIERHKGAGTMLRQNRGDPEATDDLVSLYVWRHNLARDIAAAIRGGKLPEFPKAEGQAS